MTNEESWYRTFYLWGKDAARRGWKRDQNPYAKGSRARSAWDKGWMSHRKIEN